MEYAKRRNEFLGGDYCYRKEGQSTIAYELIFQTKRLNNVIAPIGNATLISALYKAFSIAQKAHMIDAIPKLIGVEAAGCAPLYYAYKHNEVIKYMKPHTKADAIAVGFPTYGSQALEAIKMTRGNITIVDDNSMEKEQNKFKKEYGLIAELAGVASLSAYHKIKPKGTIMN